LLIAGLYEITTRFPKLVGLPIAASFIFQMLTASTFYKFLVSRKKVEIAEKIRRDIENLIGSYSLESDSKE